jgi:hypothetical protein
VKEDKEDEVSSTEENTKVDISDEEEEEITEKVEIKEEA